MLRGGHRDHPPLPRPTTSSTTASLGQGLTKPWGSLGAGTGTREDARLSSVLVPPRSPLLSLYSASLCTLCTPPLVPFLLPSPLLSSPFPGCPYSPVHMPPLPLGSLRFSHCSRTRWEWVKPGAVPGRGGVEERGWYPEGRGRVELGWGGRGAHHRRPSEPPAAPGLAEVEPRGIPTPTWNPRHEIPGEAPDPRRGGGSAR